jgi:hypothetical protein
MPPDAAIEALYVEPTVASGSEVVVMVNGLVRTGATTVRLRVAVVDCAVGCVESVTVITTDAVPTELCAGVPVIAPVELPIDKPLGRPVALNV